MSNLKTIEIKAFVPTNNFELSKQFYQDLGFTMGSDANGIAYFSRDHCSFLLQDFYEPLHCQNFMMHLLVEDIESWHEHVLTSGVQEKYGIKISKITEQPWKMLDFFFSDPSEVLWRIGQNI